MRPTLLVGGGGMNAGLCAGGETGLLKSRFGLLKERGLFILKSGHVGLSVSEDS